MIRRLLTIGLLGVVIALLLPPAPASAHAYLVRSAPGDGSVLDRSPEALTLSFTESVEREATHVDIVDGDGRRFAPTSIVVHGGDTESPSEVVVGLPSLPPNTYHITWRTLSSDDLHATTGNLVRGVQRAVAAAKVPSGPAA